MPFLLFFLYRDKDKATSILSIGIAAEHERDGLPALRDRRHHSGNSVGSVSRCRSAGSAGWHKVCHHRSGWSDSAWDRYPPVCDGVGLWSISRAASDRHLPGGDPLLNAGGHPRM